MKTAIAHICPLICVRLTVVFRVRVRLLRIELLLVLGWVLHFCDSYMVYDWVMATNLAADVRDGDIFGGRGRCLLGGQISSNNKTLRKCTELM